MARIAILFNSNLDNRRGVDNAVINKAKFLKAACPSWQIDVYSIATFYGPIARLIKRSKRVDRLVSKTVDGVNIHIIWHRFSIISYLMSYKLHIAPFNNKNNDNIIVNLLKGYDLVSAHSTSSGRIARMVKAIYGVPYTETWHGSDIHTFPFTQNRILRETDTLLCDANMNIFVSKALLNTARSFSQFKGSVVIYNGVGEHFKQYSPIEKLTVKKRLGIYSKNIVAFVGNVIEIKNANLLPDIFKTVSDAFDGEVEFLVIGDGDLKKTIKTKTEMYSIPVYYMGNQPPEIMPDLMNCIDVLVLPSKNEGLPLVTVEALSCGVNVVGSNVGGIPEVIGSENCFELDENFITNISSRIVFMLNSDIKQRLNDYFSWEKSAHLEAKTYAKIINETK